MGNSFCSEFAGVFTVLSGMSNVEQMADNLSYMRDFEPLNEAERDVILQAQRIMGESSTIACTACHYCTNGCPQNIPIPEIFAAANLRLGNGRQKKHRPPTIRLYRRQVQVKHLSASSVGSAKVLVRSN